MSATTTKGATNTAVPKPLSKAEGAALIAHEHTITDGVKGFIKAGKALEDIRRRRLYRGTHTEFGAYCNDRWSLSKRHVNRLIASSVVADIVGPIGPTSESVARPLANLDPDPMLRAWKSAVKAAANGVPTARDTADAVARIQSRARSLEHKKRWAARQEAEVIETRPECDLTGVTAVVSTRDPSTGEVFDEREIDLGEAQERQRGELAEPPRATTNVCPVCGGDGCNMTRGVKGGAGYRRAGTCDNCGGTGVATEMAEAQYEDDNDHLIVELERIRRIRRLVCEAEELCMDFTQLELTRKALNTMSQRLRAQLEDPANADGIKPAVVDEPEPEVVEPEPSGWPTDAEMAEAGVVEPEPEVVEAKLATNTCPTCDGDGGVRSKNGVLLLTLCKNCGGTGVASEEADENDDDLPDMDAGEVPPLGEWAKRKRTVAA